MNKAERAVAALKEAADAVDALPHNLRFQRPGIFGPNGPIVDPAVLREEAGRIEHTVEEWRQAYEDVNRP